MYFCTTAAGYKLTPRLQIVTLLPIFESDQEVPQKTAGEVPRKVLEINSSGIPRKSKKTNGWSNRLSRHLNPKARFCGEAPPPLVLPGYLSSATCLP